MAAAAFALYGLHARRPAPILELRMFRYRAFAVAIVGGAFSRIAFGGALLLFPLLFQLGLRASALVSGVLMGLTALGQILMRPLIDPLLKSVGIRWTLIGNSLVLAVLLSGLLAFGPHASLWLLGALLFVIGLAQSVQLSTLAALNFSGMPAEALGKATSIAAVIQRLTAATGITLVAIALAGASGGQAPVLADFPIPIMLLCAVTLLGAPCYVLLRRTDGADLLQRRG